VAKFAPGLLLSDITQRDLVVRDGGRPRIVRRGISFKGVVKAVGNVSILRIAFYCIGLTTCVSPLGRQSGRQHCGCARPSCRNRNSKAGRRYRKEYDQSHRPNRDQSPQRRVQLFRRIQEEVVGQHRLIVAAVGFTVRTKELVSTLFAQ
jgi:hypothetical protein